MSNLALQYYTKAMDSYPYDLTETLEALEYALSYDEEHAGAHCLMGKFYAEQYKDYRSAFYHFEKALTFDLEHIDTYYAYASALILFGDYTKARRVLNHAEKVRGVCAACILERKAQIFELNGNFEKAKKQLKKAIRVSIYNQEISYLKEELKRVKEKSGK